MHENDNEATGRVFLKHNEVCIGLRRIQMHRWKLLAGCIETWFVQPRRCLHPSVKWLFQDEGRHPVPTPHAAAATRKATLARRTEFCLALPSVTKALTRR